MKIAAIIRGTISSKKFVKKANFFEKNSAYPFAKRALSSNTLKRIDSECEDFKKEMEKSGVQNKYVKALEFLERKYK